MTDEPSPPESLLALTNWQSRALLPSEIDLPEFVDWAHAHGAYLYLVLVGPRTEIVELIKEDAGWKMRALFHDGSAMKPRMIPVPFEVFAEEGTCLVDGAIDWVDSERRPRRSNAVEVVRRVLQRAWLPGQPLEMWHHNTLRKFFTYRVEYIGQSFGKKGERTAAERIGQGHKTVQQVLAETLDHNPNSSVAYVVLDAHVQGRELTFSVGPDNVDDIARLATQFMADPDGPLADQAKLVTAAEAMLIRSFPATRNKQFRDFPIKDAPTLVEEMLDAGITHLGVQLDVSQSLALLRHPDESREPAANLRFAVNLRTGEPEALRSTAPLTWRVN